LGIIQGSPSGLLIQIKEAYLKLTRALFIIQLSNWILSCGIREKMILLRTTPGSLEPITGTKPTPFVRSYFLKNEEIGIRKM
jgi:hypothetical protein